MKVQIDASYVVWASNEIELPEGRTKEDIKDIWISWEEGVIEWKDGTEFEFEFDISSVEGVYKRPSDIGVYDAWQGCQASEANNE